MRVRLRTSSGKTIEVTRYRTWDFYGYSKRKGISIAAPVYSFEAIDYLVEEINEKIRQDFDQIILITGDEGVGKSSLACHLAVRLGLREPRICFNAQQALDMIAQAGREEVIWLDEAGVALYSDETWMTEERRLIKAFQIVRAKNLKFILCLPHRQILAKKIRERRIHWWLNCFVWAGERGWCRVRKPRKDEFHLEAFWEPVFTFHYPDFRSWRPRNGFPVNPAEFWADYYELKLRNLQAELDRSTSMALEARERLRREFEEWKRSNVEN